MPGLVSGSVSLLRQEPALWPKNFASAKVFMQGNETDDFRLNFTCPAMRQSVVFELCDLSGNTIRSWPFHFSFSKTTLDLDDQSARKLRYEF